MDEVRADAPRSLLVEHQAFALDAGQPTDARADGHARAQLGGLVHVGKAGVLDRLAGGIETKDDERIDLALDLVVDALRGIEAIFVVGRLHLAGDAAFLIAGVELGDRTRAAFRRDDVLPAGFDVTPERRYQPETRHHDTAHLSLQTHQQAQTRSG